MNIQRNRATLLSKPAMNYSYHSSNSKNIFDTVVPPDLHQKFGPQFNEKGLMKHTIIGKPEWFHKVAKQKDTQLRFINDDDSLINQRRVFHKQKTLNQNDSTSNLQLKFIFYIFSLQKIYQNHILLFKNPQIF